MKNNQSEFYSFDYASHDYVGIYDFNKCEFKLLEDNKRVFLESPFYINSAGFKNFVKLWHAQHYEKEN